MTTPESLLNAIQTTRSEWKQLSESDRESEAKRLRNVICRAFVDSFLKFRAERKEVPFIGLRRLKEIGHLRASSDVIIAFNRAVKLTDSDLEAYPMLSLIVPDDVLMTTHKASGKLRLMFGFSPVLYPDLKPDPEVFELVKLRSTFFFELYLYS